MVGAGPIDVRIMGLRGMVLSFASWPGLSRPPTTGGAETGKVVDGRDKPGHDVKATIAAILTPMEPSPAMTIRTGRLRISTCLRFAVAAPRSHQHRKRHRPHRVAEG